MYDTIQQCIEKAVLRKARRILKKIERHFRGKRERLDVLDLWESHGDGEGLAAALMRIIEDGDEEHGECAELAETYKVSRSTVSKHGDRYGDELASGVLQGMKEVIEESTDGILHDLLPEIKQLAAFLK